MSNALATPPLRGWRITVTVPDDVPASHAERVMARYALERMFRDGKLYVSELRAMRSLLGLPPAAASLDTMLHVLHCEEIRSLPADVQELLPALVGEYVGVQIVRVPETVGVLPALRVVEAAERAGTPTDA